MLGLQSNLSLPDIPIEIFYAFLISPYVLHAPPFVCCKGTSRPTALWKCSFVLRVCAVYGVPQFFIYVHWAFRWIAMHFRRTCEIVSELFILFLLHWHYVTSSFHFRISPFFPSSLLRKCFFKFLNRLCSFFPYYFPYIFFIVFFPFILV
jgi:hypothetical protein